MDALQKIATECPYKHWADLARSALAERNDLLAELRSVSEALAVFIEQACKDSEHLRFSVHGRALAGMAESGQLCLDTARAAIAKAEGK